MKPSERIKQITDEVCENNPKYARLSAHLWAIEIYLDEEYEVQEAAKVQLLKDIKPM